MLTPEIDPANALDAVDFLERAKRCTVAHAELNFGADLVMAVDAARHSGKPLDLNNTETVGEEMILQVAFFNNGLKVDSSFIIKSVAAGWRYRIGKGFHKLETGAC